MALRFWPFRRRKRTAVAALHTDPKTKDSDRCPSCGFLFAYDGVNCGHCGWYSGNAQASRVQHANRDHDSPVGMTDDDVAWRVSRSLNKVRVRLANGRGFTLRRRPLHVNQESPADRKLDYLTRNHPLHSFAQIERNPSRVSKNKTGVYAWYLDRLPELISGVDLLAPDHRSLVYIGIAMGQSLHERVVQKHVLGSIAVSTFRESMAALLSEELGLERFRSGDYLNKEGEEALNKWLREHAFLNCLTDQDADEIETLAFTHYGEYLPLNIKNNPKNPVINELKQLRSKRSQQRRLTSDRLPLHD